MQAYVHCTSVIVLQVQGTRDRMSRFLCILFISCLYHCVNKPQETVCKCIHQTVSSFSAYDWFSKEQPISAYHSFEMYLMRWFVHLEDVSVFWYPHVENATNKPIKCQKLILPDWVLGSLEQNTIILTLKQEYPIVRYRVVLCSQKHTFVRVGLFCHVALIRLYRWIFQDTRNEMFWKIVVTNRQWSVYIVHTYVVLEHLIGMEKYVSFYLCAWFPILLFLGICSTRCSNKKLTDDELFCFRHL